MQIADEYNTVREIIDEVRQAFPDNSRIPEMFKKCISNTLQTTIKKLDDGSMFVITGDIPAMWLRDSSCQLRPFISMASREPKIREIITGLIRKQMSLILIDAYANAFNEGANGRGFQQDRTEMKPEIWERKFEIDSLCFPIQLSYLFWKNTGYTDFFDDVWLAAVKRIMEVFRIEQDHEIRSDYRFERMDCRYTDTLSRDGKGALVRGNIGLIWSGFRPSDDACTYGYLIPSNMLASVILGNIAEIARGIYHDKSLAVEARDFSTQVRNAVEDYGIIKGLDRDVYAYEVDGFGQYNIMDDANLPSLLSIPYIGYCSKGSHRYQNTRKLILSDVNPYYYSGRYMEGIGSPHTPCRYVWHIAIAMRGLTADNQEEKERMLAMLEKTDAGTGYMHEGVNVDNPGIYTRPWFSWANSVFCEFVLDYCGYRLIKE